MPQAAIEIVSDQEHVKKFGQKGKTQIAQPVKEKPLIEKHKTSIGEAVVDLHIGELIDNITGLTNHDMLNIQIEYFKKTLNSAITNDYTKVTFIHGVGNGVLKSAIIKELEAYEGLENKMASISKFGVGAIDVLIKNKD
jgi:dsDNA-specific endonuclease/ATPase MutS2